MKLKPAGWVAAASLGILAIALAPRACVPDRARVASFNIEDYPKSPEQIRQAFDLIGSLHAQAIAVQEITDADGFEAEAKARLGPTWRFVHDKSENTHRVGLLYDGATLELISARVWPDTVLNGLGKPTLEARFKRQGRALRLLVVHLKAGGENFPIRALQLKALQTVLQKANASGDEVVLLGDFNATGLADRTAIATLATASGLHWASSDLGCTSYWRLPEECRGTALDQVLATEAVDVTAAGPCARSCDFGRTCPRYVEEVSDHCPVVVELR